jgi:hypothetical protein
MFARVITSPPTELNLISIVLTPLEAANAFFGEVSRSRLRLKFLCNEHFGRNPVSRL